MPDAQDPHESESETSSPGAGCFRGVLAVGILGVFVSIVLRHNAIEYSWSHPEAYQRLLVASFGFFALVLFLGLCGPSPERDEPGEPEAWLCKHCLKPYVPGAHFCPRCSAPQTFFAWTAHYEQVYALTWCLGKAAWYPTSVIHPVGLLLACIPLGFFASPLTFLLALPLAIIGVISWIRHGQGRPRARAIEYGTPPWWTYDAEWILPEYEEEPISHDD